MSTTAKRKNGDEAQNEAEVYADIARLQAAIARAKQEIPSQQPVAQDNHARYQQPQYAAPRGRGRGMGRGTRATVLPYRGGRGGPVAYSAQSHQSKPVKTMRNMSWTPNTPTPSSSAATTDGVPEKADRAASVQTSRIDSAASTQAQAPEASSHSSRNFQSKHKKLVLNGSGSVASTTTQAGKEVVIEGVTFVSDATGRKLVRKDRISTTALPTKPATFTPNTRSTHGTPSKTSIGGQSYVRTKSGNLVHVDLVKKRELEAKKKRLDNLVGIVKNVHKARSARPVVKGRMTRTTSKILCRFFQKTGICTRGLTCPYVHDFNKVSICPRFLRSKCSLISSTCPLSHEPNAHRMPHCQHFPFCKNGEACIYPHVHVATDAKICKDFVNLGWCEKGLECKERHVWECPEFSETGVCRTKGCKLPHIIRRRGGAEASDGTNSASVVSPPNSSEGNVQRAKLSESIETNSVANEKKRAIEEDETSDQEVEATLQKKQRTDGVQANEDFVTLVISDSEYEEDESGEEEDDDDDSSVESDEVDFDDDNASAALSESSFHPQSGISHNVIVGDRFSRRQRDDDDDSDSEGDSA